MFSLQEQLIIRGYPPLLKATVSEIIFFLLITEDIHRTAVVCALTSAGRIHAPLHFRGKTWGQKTHIISFSHRKNFNWHFHPP